MVGPKRYCVSAAEEVFLLASKNQLMAIYWRVYQTRKVDPRGRASLESSPGSAEVDLAGLDSPDSAPRAAEVDLRGLDSPECAPGGAEVDLPGLGESCGDRIR